MYTQTNIIEEDFTMKKLFTTLTTATALTLALSASTYAQSNEPIESEPTETIGDTELIDSKAVLDMGAQNLQSITEPIEIAPLSTKWNINWSLAKGERAYGESRFSLSKGNKVSFSLSWSPQPDNVAVGLYDHNTGKYHPLKNSPSSPYSGSFTAPNNGLFSFHVHNTSTTSAITVKGSFTVH